MVPLSTKDRVRFTPARYEGLDGYGDGEGQRRPPVYVLQPFDWRSRGRFRGALAAEGIRYPQDREIAAEVASVIREAAPENEAELLAQVEAFLALLDEKPPEEPAADASDEDQAAYKAELARRFGVALPYDGLVDTLRGTRRIAHLLQLRTLFNELAPLIAATYALRGWENLDAKCRVVDGVVTDESFQCVPTEDQVAIGTEALRSLTLSAQQRGN